MSIVPQEHIISKEDRRKSYKHRSLVLWFTGLSGSGKSTLANKVEELLFQKGIKTFILDGDNIRAGLNKDLTFSDEDRSENIRRIGEVSKLFVDAGVVVLTAFISPFRSDRKIARDLLPEGDFVEIYVKCPLEICEQRDVKGLYAKARKGLIKDFTGIHSIYEEPVSAEIIVETNVSSINECANKIADHILPALMDK